MISEGRFVACTGLQDSRRPVFCNQKVGNYFVYQSSRMLKTGLLESVKVFCVRVPVFKNVEDRSSVNRKEDFVVCTGLQEC